MSTIVSLSNARPGADAVTGELSAAVADSIKMAVAEIERGRRLPAPLVDTLTRAGLFGLYTPVEHGGAELDPAAFCRIIEAAGRLDASTAWCLWNGNCGLPHRSSTQPPRKQFTALAPRSATPLASLARRSRPTAGSR